jgi:hypothetical protein
MARGNYDETIQGEMKKRGNARLDNPHRGGQEERDAAVRRLNIRRSGRNSTAYTPGPDQGARGRNASKGGGGGGRKPSGGRGVPTPTPRPQNENFDDPYGTTGRPMPTGRPEEQDGTPWWLIPLLAGASTGAGAYAAQRFRKRPQEGEVLPPEANPRRAEITTPGREPPIIEGEVIRDPAQLEPPARQLPAPSTPIDEVMQQSEPDPARFYTPEEIEQMRMKNELNRSMADPSTGTAMPQENLPYRPGFRNKGPYRVIK